MSEPAISSTQYGDLQGTISVDVNVEKGPFLQEVAKRSDMPKDYFPVGFTFYNETGEQIQVLALRR